MSEFDLSPKNRSIPPPNIFQRTAVTFPLDELYHVHLDSLASLLHRFRVRHQLSPTDVYETAFTYDDLLQKIQKKSYPLGLLLQQHTAFPITREWLMYFELYSRFLYVPLGTRMEAIAKDAANRRDVRKSDYIEHGIQRTPIRTFHIGDNTGESIAAMGKILNKIEFNSQTTIGHSYLATYTPTRNQQEQILHTKARPHWIIGSDGEGRPTNNIRSWANSIASSIKVVDVLISAIEVDTSYVIAFALLNLAPSGHAFINIPMITDAASITLIHLCSQVFTSVKILHTLSADRVFLCCSEYLGISTPIKTKIMDWCERGGESLGLFNLSYLETTEFVDTVEKLISYISAIYNFRYEYYEKLFEVYQQLIKSESANTFDGFVDTFLEEKYPDISKKWVTVLGFDYWNRLDN